MPNYELIPIGSNAPDEVNTIIEVAKGSSNKYKFHGDSGNFRYDHTLYSPLFYPYDYGWICGTKCGHDKKPLNCLVIATNATFPGCLIVGRPIATLLMQDGRGTDNKVICVAVSDPRFTSIRSLNDLSTHALLEVQHFFEIYQALEQHEVRIEGWEDSDKTKQRIIESL